MAGSTPLRFDILQAGQVVRTERLLESRIKVGKLSASHLRVDDPAVARMHAYIEVHGPDEVELIDLGSSRGTLVNGSRIERQRLRSGDRLGFGATEVVVYIGEADIAAADRGAFHGGALAAAAPVAAAAAPAVAAAPAPGTPAAPPAPPQPAMGKVQQYYAQRQVAMEAQMAAQAAQIEVDDTGGKRSVEVTFVWGDTVQSVQHFPAGQDITIGDAARCTYYVDPRDLQVESFPLVKAVGAEAALSFNDAMRGHVRLGDGSTFSLDQLRDSGRAIASGDAPGAYRFLMPEGARCRIDYGDVAFFVNMVPAPRRQPYPFLWPFTLPEMATMGAAGLMWAVFLVLAFLAIPDIDGFRLDSFNSSNRFVSIIVMPERPDEADVPDWFKDMNKEKEKKSTPKAKGSEGKMGKKDSDKADRKFAVKGPKDNKSIELRRKEILEKVVQTGALAALSAPSEELSAIWGRSDRAVGSDAVHAIGNWTGASVGHARGFGGLGLSGTGRGGGGVTEGSLGVGTLGTRGRGSGRLNYGRGVGNLGDRSGRIPKVIPGRAMVTGSLDREIIRRVISKHRPEIKYCYESQLVKHKDLMGKIVVTFVIAPTGSVMKAFIKQSTMKNKAVESCIVQRVKRWKFPAPKGGGVVEVTYPFIFKST